MAGGKVMNLGWGLRSRWGRVVPVGGGHPSVVTLEKVEIWSLSSLCGSSD